ncbi:MAG: ATP-binding protein [Rubrobacteraceae bacterium]
MDRETEEKGRFEMGGGTEPLKLRVPSSSEYVLIARLVVAHVGQVAGFGPEEIYDLKLAVTEAATNVIRHAAVDSFDIEYRALPGAVEVTVTDAGGGFDVKERNPSPEDGQGGFGLSVIRNLVDEMIIDSSAGGGTRLRMLRRAGASAEASNG